VSWLFVGILLCAMMSRRGGQWISRGPWNSRFNLSIERSPLEIGEENGANMFGPPSTALWDQPSPIDQ